MTDYEVTAASYWDEGRIARRIGDARTRTRVVLTGTIRTAETVTVAASSAYRCVLGDGTGELDLVFLGRSTIAGLAVGTRCRVEGMARMDGARLVVWNPRYRLELPDGFPETESTAALPLASEEVQLTASGDDEAGRKAGGTRTEVADVTGVTGIMHDVEATGHFRIYLGAAAGVGKTMAMLDEGQRRRKGGTDVVIGFVESHGRPVTQARTAGLEVVRRQVVNRRGARLEEMDLDAVLRRHPTVVLVDELAHTNVPESRALDIGGRVAAWCRSEPRRCGAVVQ